MSTGLLPGPLTECPTCHGAVRSVCDGEATNFACTECGRCWHVSLGHIRLVAPVTCPGCELHPSCLRRLAEGA